MVQDRPSGDDQNRGFLRNLIANYFAPLYLWGWWSVFVWVVCLLGAAALTFLEE